MNFEEFEKEARKILRLQDKNQVDIFLSICPKPLGLYEWSDDEIEGLVEDYYIESLSGGVPKDLANKSSEEYRWKLIVDKYRDLIPARHYKPRKSLALQEQNRALRILENLVRLQTKRKVEGLCLNLDDVQKSIDFIEDSLKVNQVMNTGGKPIDLSDQDLWNLSSLKNIYIVCFPENSKKNKSGSLLQKLGKALIGKTIPRNIDKQLDKVTVYIRNQEG